MRASFPLVPLPGVSSGLSARDILTDTGRWAANEPIARLVETFGGRVPDGDADTILTYLDAFSERWDYRKGKERNLAEDPEFDEPTSELILAVAEALGMTGSNLPQRNRYTHVLVLGGLVRACVTRPEHAARLVAEGVSTTSVTALTAFRPLSSDEIELAVEGGLGSVTNEFEAMQAGMARAFALNPADMEVHRSGVATGNSLALRGVWRRGGNDIVLVVAPSPDPARRANTADTYRYWARNTHIGPEDELLVVTSAIYVPQQHSDAVKTLTLTTGARVETLGVDTATREGVWRQDFSPAKYLQEIRSGIRAVKALRSEATARL